MRRFILFLVLMALAGSSAAGYYHFVHYPSRLGPYDAPIYEKFDLNALVDKTVYFYISDQQPALAPGDSYEVLIGQVRQALGVWNGVATSDLRVAFGGVADIASLQPQNPDGEIIFDDLPPGVIGLGGPVTRLEESRGFIPILRSRVILPRDLSSRSSASESFYTSLVHEIGHALGLQHTMTASAMATEVTRATTRAQPLAADDMAGISWLYPAAGFASSTGTITGRVTGSGGQPLNLISVVAMNPSGAVIGALTAPDGSYRIDGLPPGNYTVFAQSLPPSSDAGLGSDNIVLPEDDTGAPFQASGPVETQFFGGVKDPGASPRIIVAAGQASGGVDFQLGDRSSLALYDVTTYSFPGNGAPAILPAFLNIRNSTGTVVAYGPGLAASVGRVTVGIFGGGVTVQPGSPFPYGPDPRYTEIDLGFNPFTGAGQRHLIFGLNGDIYVRPGGVQLVTRQAPLVREADPAEDANGNAVLDLVGDNLSADSRVFVDGAPATLRAFDGDAGRLRVVPPPGVSGRQALITVDNPDGQSSVFVQPSTPATYTYPETAGPPSLVVNPASGLPGRDLMIDIQGTNTNFADGQTVAGFGTPDVVARRVWVLSPTHLLAVVTISPRAAEAATTVTVVSGSQVTTLTQRFPETPGGGAGPNVAAPILTYQGLVNSASNQPRLAPGALASLFGVNLSLQDPASSGTLPLPTTLAGTTVTLNNQPVPLLLVTPTQINLQLPFALPTGPAILRVSNGSATSAPMVVQIDAVAPGLFRAFNSVNAPVDSGHPAKVGDTIVLYATGLGPVQPPGTAGVAAGVANATGKVRVNIAGVDLAPNYAGLTPGSAGVYQVNVTLPSDVPAASATQVFVTVDGVASNALAISIQNP